MRATRVKQGRYWKVYMPEHPRQTIGYVFEHVLIAEAALGRALPAGAQVHHVNGDGLDNRRENLVICEDQAYHTLLHMRTRGLKAAGNPNFRKCWICGEYDDLANLWVRPRNVPIHRTCDNRRRRERRVPRPRRPPFRGGNRKVNDAQVLEIRNRLARGEDRASVAAAFGLAVGTVRGIATGGKRRNVPMPADLTLPVADRAIRRKLTWEQVLEIRSIRGVSISDLSRRFAVSRKNIRAILDEKVWKPEHHAREVGGQAGL